jgi:hypothetical protein
LSHLVFAANTLTFYVLFKRLLNEPLAKDFF